jgi:hypothetical protein
MFGLPFPTYLGWIIWPAGIVVILAIINFEYKKYRQGQMTPDDDK